MKEPFSRRTAVVLAPALALRSHADLTALSYEFGLDSYDHGINKMDRALPMVRGLREHVPAQKAREIFLELVETLYSQLPGSCIEARDEFRALQAALKVEGYSMSGHQIVPTTPERAVLAPRITRWESQLNALGMTVAATHYRQAVDNFTDTYWEAANSQTHSFVEALLLGIAAVQDGKALSTPQAALQRLQKRGLLDDAEYQLFKPFWPGIQDNRPHAGLGDEEEALFRLHSATVIARYLLAKVGSN